MFATVARVAGRRSVAFASAQIRVAAPVFRGMATMYFTPSHEYVCVDGDVATVGITDHAAGALGDVVYVELPDKGDAFEVGDSFGSVESVKAASDIYLPVGGEVLEANPVLKDEPGTVNTSPFENGWFVRIRITDDAPLAGLMDADAYQQHIDEQ